MSKRCMRPGAETRTPIDASKRERFLRVQGRRRTSREQSEKAAREAGQREQIPPVVLQDGAERPRIAGTEKLEVPGRDLDSCHVGRAMCAEHLRFERPQRTAARVSP